MCVPAVAVAASGRVYDAKAGRYVQGARITVLYDETDASQPGQMVPADRLGPGQQGQETTAEGIYRLDLPPGRRYRVVLDPPAGYAFPSQIIPPTPGFAPEGPVVPEPTPSLAPDARRIYYLRFDRTDVTNNHIPLDPLTALVVQQVKADRPAAGSGDVVGFDLSVENRSMVDLPRVVMRFRPDRALVVGGAIGGEIRFGPADLAAGGTLRYKARAVVQADAPPGTYHATAVTLGADGSAVSGEGTATVRVESDAVFDQGIVLGRVFCDDDGDGRKGPGERGIDGARVALETGTYARTDSTGKYHLTAIEPGVHIVKLDEATLPPGGKAEVDASVIYFTRGLPVRVSFGVTCLPPLTTTLSAPEGSIRLSGKHAPAPPEPRTSVTVVGDLGALTASIDDEAIAFPSVEVTLVAPDTLLLPPAPRTVGPNLRPPGVAGFEAPVTFKPAIHGDLMVRRWTLTLARNQGRILRTFRGEGTPADVMWDGLDGDGKPIGRDEIIVYQLQVDGRGGVLAASARRTFGVGFGTEPPPERTETWRGELFTADKQPRATDALVRRAQALVRTLGPGDDVLVEIHDAGGDDALAALARTQRQAEAARQALVEAGLPPRRIQSRGRGALSPLGPATTDAGRAKNRRVLVRVIPPAPQIQGLPIPSAAPAPAEALVGGKVAKTDAAGRFVKNVPIPASGEVAVEIVAADGRRATRVVPVAPGKAQPTKTVRLSGDATRGTLLVDGQPFDAWLLAVDVGLRGTDAALPRRLVFEPAIPPTIEASSWELTVWRASAPPPAEPVWRAGRSGPPAASIEWRRAAATPGETFLVRLAVEDGHGGWGASPLREVRVAGATDPYAGVSGRARLFTVAGEPTPLLHERLAALVAAMAQRPTERVLVQVRGELLEVSPGERRLALATRAGRVKQLLVKLGAPVDRLVVAGVAGPDALIVTSEPLPQPASARVTVDGRDANLRGGTFDATATVPAGGATVVEMVMPDGHRAAWVIPTGPAPPRVRSSSPLRSVSLADDPSEFGGKELDDALAPPERPGRPAPRRFIRDAATGKPVAVPAGVDAADLEVGLPARGATLSSTDLWVSGRTHPGNRVRVAGADVPVREDGRFDALATLPAGASDLAIESEDAAGNVGRLTWPVVVSDTAQFLVALADGGIANARIDGMTDHTTVSWGDAVFHGRVAAFYQGRFPGGDLFRHVKVTAQVDTARRGAFEPFYRQVIDPARDFVFGDSSAEVAAAPSRGKVYARVEADESSAVLGSFTPDLHQGLLSYDRTLQGGTVDFRRSFGALDQRVQVFGATTEARLARDVNVFRTTGGTLYYLRNRRVVEGGERVRLLVRDAVSGIPLYDKELERNGDYLIDYPAGRVQLKAPVASMVEARAVLTNLAATQTPLGGNPVYLEVSYEYESEGMGAGAGGMYVSERVGGFSLGGGVVGEVRDDAPNYTLAGADLTFQPDPDTRLRVELAASRSVEAQSFLSQDGGLSFQGLSVVGEQAAGGDTQLAWKVDFRSKLNNVVDAEWARRTQVSLYAQSLDRGFSSGGTVLEQGRTKFGGEVKIRVGERDLVTLRHDTQLSDLPIVGPTPAVVSGLADPLELDHVGTYLTSLQWARTGKALDLTLQAAHQRLGSTAQELAVDRFGMGGLLGWKLSKRLTLRFGQEVQFTTSDRDPLLRPIDPASTAVTQQNGLAGVATSVGADMELAPGLVVSGTGILRWNGDTAAVAGLKTPIDQSASMYLQERLEERSSRLVSTSVVGGEERFGGGRGGRAYGEYQIESGVLGARNRAVMGVGHRFDVARGLGLTAGFEHQETRGGYLPDGTPTGESRRDVVSVGAEYVRPARFKASAVVEARFDEGVADIDPAYGPLVAADARQTSPPGTYPDHGGVAPGTPLAILPGQSRQLVGRAACDVRLAADHTFLLRLNAADTRADGATFARFVEATAGWAFRPIEQDWLDILVKYSFIYDRRPAAASGESSHVVALVPILDLPWSLRLSGKLAFKRTEADVAADSLVALLRLGWLFGRRWDVAAEYRLLRVGRDDAAELKHGALVEVAFFLDKRIRLGVGYNFTHFSDDEMTDLDADTHGFFFRVVGRY